MVFSGRIYVGADGFGEKLKEPMARHLKGRGLEVEDLGTGKYYEVAAAVARAVQVGAHIGFVVPATNSAKEHSAIRSMVPQLMVQFA